MLTCTLKTIIVDRTGGGATIVESADVLSKQNARRTYRSIKVHPRLSNESWDDPTVVGRVDGLLGGHACYIEG